MFKPTKNFFTIILGSLVVILLAFGLLRMKFGPFLPATIDKNLPDAVIVAAIGIMLWNRKILADEKKAEEARKKEEEEAEAAKRAEVVGTDEEEDRGESGNDARP